MHHHQPGCSPQGFFIQSSRAAEQLSRPAEPEQAGKVRACRGAASPHPAGYLGQVDVLTGRLALSAIPSALAYLGRVRHPCIDASEAVRSVQAQRWPRQADRRYYVLWLGRVSKSEQRGRSTEAGRRWAQWCDWCC
jgi:hypothetical protein